MSLGLPIAYLFTLLFIHVPGAIAHMVGGDTLVDTPATEIGIRFTAIGAACFVVGVWLARQWKHRQTALPVRPSARLEFAFFCFVVGIGITYTLRLVINAPSIGAVIEKAGGIWILGVLIGLGTALRNANAKAATLWLGAMAIYPVLTLLLGGFLSFGSTPVFIILAGLVISTRSSWKVAIGLPLIAYVFFILFLSYFQNRNNIRDSVWGGKGMSTRVENSTNMVRDIQLFDPHNDSHLIALDLRLNQNFFVGRAAERIQSGQVAFLHGRSFMEGLMALVPRMIWPEKPVYGGSPAVIMEMTGFIVNDTTSYGVGNVMEFYINYGVPSLVGGFLCLGLLLGWLDYRAAAAISGGDLGGSMVFFLPAATMIQPNGSLVELTSGGAAAFVAAVGWRWLWRQWKSKQNSGEERQWPRTKKVKNTSLLDAPKEQLGVTPERSVTDRLEL